MNEKMVKSKCEREMTGRGTMTVERYEETNYYNYLALSSLMSVPAYPSIREVKYQRRKWRSLEAVAERIRGRTIPQHPPPHI